MDLETGNGRYSVFPPSMGTTSLFEPQSDRPKEVPEFIAEVNQTMWMWDEVPLCIFT